MTDDPTRHAVQPPNEWQRTANAIKSAGRSWSVADEFPTKAECARVEAAYRQVLLIAAMPLLSLFAYFNSIEWIHYRILRFGAPLKFLDFGGHFDLISLCVDLVVALTVSGSFAWLIAELWVRS